MFGCFSCGHYLNNGTQEYWDEGEDENGVQKNGYRHLSAGINASEDRLAKDEWLQVIYLNVSTSEDAAIARELIVTFNIVVANDFSHVLVAERSGGHLVVVREDFICFQNADGTVSEVYSWLHISVDVVLQNFRVWTPTANETSALVFEDNVFRNVRRAIEHHNAVGVLMDFVIKNPSKPCFNAEDTLAPGLLNFVVYNDRVTALFASEGDVCLIILFDQVFLNVGVCRFNK